MNEGLEALKRLFIKIKHYDSLDEKVMLENDYSTIEKELKEKEKQDKFVKLVIQWLDNEHDITKILKDIENSESYGDFISLYPFALKEEYNLLKEVLNDD